jgi:hypothetical protein
MRLHGVAPHDHYALAYAGKSLVVGATFSGKPFDTPIEVADGLVVIDSDSDAIKFYPYSDAI